MITDKKFPSAETDVPDMQRAAEGHGADQVLPRLLPQVHPEAVRDQAEEVPQVPERVRPQRLSQDLHRVAWLHVEC